MTRAKSAPSRVRPHQYDPDATVPADHNGRQWCRWCHLPGESGDERHPVDAASPLPPTPPEARTLDLRRLGEREDDEGEVPSTVRPSMPRRAEMIPATVPYTAVYKRQIQKGAPYYYDRQPVIAWSDDGEALVASADGDLVPASRSAAFVHVDKVDTAFIAVIPGGGWRIEWPQEDGTTLTEPVLAWGIDADGWGKPLMTDVDGSVEPVEVGKARILPPSEGAHPTSTSEGVDPANAHGLGAADDIHSVDVVETDTLLEVDLEKGQQ